MLFVLILLCVFLSVVTYDEQQLTGEAAAQQLARIVVEEFGDDCRALIVASSSAEDVQFANTLRDLLSARGVDVVAAVNGEPRDVLQAFEKIAADGSSLDVIAANHSASMWGVVENRGKSVPSLASSKLVTPGSYWWPTFLKSSNLLSVADQISVTAIIAIGMTLVIITAGIDLSVGSLIALSAVMATWFIREAAGAEQATALGVTLSCLGGIAVCALAGAFTGTLVTLFDFPPFLVTLSMMFIASGLAYTVSDGQSIYQLPESFVWLGSGADVLGIPNAVLLMFALYAAAHVVMSRTTLGRYIYAVGGNREAARLSGVPVRRLLLFVYVASGALAGLGGIVMASRLGSGSPKFGEMYELYVIAAVVLGGTSLIGGEGKVLGTLIGAFIIAVIRNGMNLTGVESYTQKIILGLVIPGAVFLDMLKKRGWRRRKSRTFHY